jgi:hypothetical protein
VFITSPMCSLLTDPVLAEELVSPQLAVFSYSSSCSLFFLSPNQLTVCLRISPDHMCRPAISYRPSEIWKTRKAPGKANSGG